MIIEENEFELIEAEMDYANYMAQKEFLDELAVISLSVRESTYLTEAENNSIKNAVMRFIHKVVANLQTAWNKFKRKITESVWNKIKTKY